MLHVSGVRVGGKVFHYMIQMKKVWFTKVLLKGITTWLVYGKKSTR